MNSRYEAGSFGASQLAISTIENIETVDDQKLAVVAKALGVSVEAIKNFSEEVVINYFNTLYDHSSNGSQGAFANNCTFNPLDKVVELYERLVQVEKDKIEYLEKLLNRK